MGKSLLYFALSQLIHLELEFLKGEIGKDLGFRRGGVLVDGDVDGDGDGDGDGSIVRSTAGDRVCKARQAGEEHRAELGSGRGQHGRSWERRRGACLQQATSRCLSMFTAARPVAGFCRSTEAIQMTRREGAGGRGSFLGRKASNF